MAGETDPLDYRNPLSFISWPNDTRANQQLRQRIALQMMSSRKGYPKNVGEGLTAIGDSLGDIGLARMLERGDLAQQEAAKTAAKGLSGGPQAEINTDQKLAYAPPDRTVADEPSRVPIEGLTGTAAQPSSMLNPSTVAVQPGVRSVGAAPPMTQEQARPYTDPRVAALPTFPRPPPPGRFAPADELNQPIDPRTAATLAVLGQRTAQAVPQSNPMQAGGPALLAEPSPSALAALPGGPGSQFAGLPPEITTGASAIRAAPPSASMLRPAPPAQVAQAQQLDPAFVTPKPGPIGAPRVVPLSPLGQRALGIINDDPNNEYVKTGEVGRTYQQEVNRQAIEQRQADKVYEETVAQNRELTRMHFEQLATAAKRQQEYDRAKQEFINDGPDAKSPSPQNMARLNTPQSQQRSGIPSAPPAPAGVTPKEWAAQQAPELAKAVASYEKAAPQFDDALKLIQLAQDHPGRKFGIGATSKIAQSMPGTDAYAFGTIMSQIGGKNFLQAYQTLKGGGSISEIEGIKAQEAQARLSTAQSKEEFDKALLDFELTLRRDMETAQRKLNRPVTAWRVGDDNTSYAPDVGTRRGNMEYIGGNPEVRSSWRPAQ